MVELTKCDAYFMKLMIKKPEFCQPWVSTMHTQTYTHTITWPTPKSNTCLLCVLKKESCQQERLQAKQTTEGVFGLDLTCSNEPWGNTIRE